MKAWFVIGLVVLILGLGSLFVSILHQERHGLRVGDASVGITTEHDEKVPPGPKMHHAGGALGRSPVGAGRNVGKR